MKYTYIFLILFITGCNAAQPEEVELSTFFENSYNQDYACNEISK